ncbi:hypothetical protein [Superficieibacter sp.]|uniref:hypothetical protein n=1 Tax=Superficieibacter sp. TaxID=2303322 RepID=UPI0039184EF9
MAKTSIPLSHQRALSVAETLLYHICIELRHRSTEGQLSCQELEREAANILHTWEKRVAGGKPVPPVRRALAAPTQAEILKAIDQLERAATASRRLRYENPELWSKLYLLDYDMLYFLFEEPLANFIELSETLRKNPSKSEEVLRAIENL